MIGERYLEEFLQRKHKEKYLEDNSNWKRNIYIYESGALERNSASTAQDHGVCPTSSPVSLYLGQESGGLSLSISLPSFLVKLEKKVSATFLPRLVQMLRLSSSFSSRPSKQRPTPLVISPSQIDMPNSLSARLSSAPSPAHWPLVLSLSRVSSWP